MTQQVVNMPPLCLSPGCCETDMPVHAFEATRSLRRTGIDMPAAWKCQVPKGAHLDSAGPVEQYEAVNTFFHRNGPFRDRSFGSVHVRLQHGGHHPAVRVPRVLDKDPGCPVLKAFLLTGLTRPGSRQGNQTCQTPPSVNTVSPEIRSPLASSRIQMLPGVWPGV